MKSEQVAAFVESRVTRSVWWHMMGIAIPDDVSNFETGFLHIDGGSNANDGPDK